MAISEIDMQRDVQAIADGLPDALRKYVMLFNRLSGDTRDAPGVNYVAYRLPLNLTDTQGISRKSCRWILLGTEGQTDLPRRGSKIVHDDLTYHVDHVERAYGDLYHRCDCFEER